MLRLFEQALHHPGGEERRAELGVTLLGYLFHQLRQVGCELDPVLTEPQLADRAGLDDALLPQLQRWLSAHLSEVLQVQDLAHAMALSPRRLQEICREQAGCTPMELLRGMRLDALAEQLCNPSQRNQSIATLMRRMGLADSAATRRDFHLRFGCSPAEYRLSLPAHQ
jgi:transcriptional regulator GlxA family with amidase domain